MEFGPRTWAQVARAPPKRHVTPKPCAQETAPAGLPRPAVTHCTPRQAATLAAASTAVHSTERLKDALPRPSIEECLPGDVLEAVLGFLDRNTLCTARLVSKAFCAAASANICSLTCRSTSSYVSRARERFPRLDRVTVHHSGKVESSAQVVTGLRDLITTLKISECQGFLSKTLAQLGVVLMPKLRELELYVDVHSSQWAGAGWPYVDMEGDNIKGIASLLSHCTTLEILILPARECSVLFATTIASMTSLRELSIGQVCCSGNWDGRLNPMGRPSDDSWLQQATALFKLQALRIETSPVALPLIANLTGLTGLTWFCPDLGSSPYSIDPLTRLTSLRSVCIEDALAESNVEIACLLGSGSLVSLDLQAAYRASDDCGRLLTRQTALARLTVQGSLCNLRHVSALRIEMLQSLELWEFTWDDVEGLSALRKATSLTRLQISLASKGWEPELQPDTARLSQGIAGLTRLRSLALRYCSGYAYRLGYLDDARVSFLDYAPAVRPLTGLTQLEIRGGGLEDAHLRAMLGLTGLQVLEVQCSRLTNAVVPELSVLTNLNKLRLVSSGVTCEVPLTRVLNPLRHARGWPPLDCKVEA